MAPDRDPVRLARDVVIFTRRSARQYNRVRSSARDLFVDVYSNALAGACVVMMVASLVVALRNEIAARSIHETSLVAMRWQVLPAGILWMALTYLAFVGIVVVARRLGPVTVGQAEGAWWLPLPIDRRPMVLPSFLRRLGAVGVVASVSYVPFSLLTALDRSPSAHVGAAATFGGGTVLAVAGAAVLQLAPASRALRASIFVGLVPVAVLPFVAAAIWPLVLVGVAATMLVAYVLHRAGAVRGSELQRGGAVSGHAVASIFFIDVNELRRSLVAERASGVSRRGSRYYARPPRRALTAVVRADVAAFLRLQPPPTAALVWQGICVGVALVTPALPVFLQLTVILIAGCVTTAGTGTVARRTAVIPELDVLLPVSPVLVRCSRTLMPALAMAAWMGALTAALAVLGAGPPSLVLLGALAGFGMGAGAVRAATRPATDWTTPPVETPFGSVPRGQLSSLLRGTDMTVLAMVPVLLALYVGVVHPWLILAQIIASATAIIVQVSTPPSR
ncbi:DUF6297 family protein [Arthrobacter agilis]|uniref:DUF6297 family protein n=1 Tax=Arthrobacter agilis TaxID=37921 RepID=UPI00278A3F0A|nr:DUF6297 family protein [Arthrobacter agilis]MDQ0734982.1 hypothetical protein [Arthrobacter agilis]